MVPDSLASLSRRRLLAAGGAVVGGVGAGLELAVSEAASTATADRPGGWPMVSRDPGGTGFAPAASGPIDDVEVEWKHSLRTGFGPVSPSPPVVADGIVYAVGEELLAARAADGETIFRLDRACDAAPAVAMAGAYRTPTVAVPRGRRTVGFHATGGPSLDGNEIAPERWAAGPASDGGVYFGMFGGKADPPVAADGVFLSTVAGSLAAIDASSGSVRWRNHVASGRPAVRDGTAYVSATLADLSKIDLETGVRSELVGDLSVREVTATPDRLVVRTAEALVGVSDDGTIQWRFDPSSYYFTSRSVAVGNGVAYVGVDTDDGDRLLAVDATDGSLQWETDVAVSELEGVSPPAVTGDMVYVPAEGGELVGVDRSDGTIRWRFSGDQEFQNWSAVAVVDGTVYAVMSGHRSYLYALEEA